MSMPDLWSAEVLIPTARHVNRQFAIVPRERIPPKPVMRRRAEVPPPPPSPPRPIVVSAFGIEFSVLSPVDKSIAQIAEQVAAKHGWTVAAMRTSFRRHSLVLARHEAWSRCYREVLCSLPKIARFFDKDHTTILNGIHRHEERMAKEAAVNSQ